MERAYFIDSEIYFQGEKQPPTKVECFDLSIAADVATFYDEYGNGYNLPANRIFYGN